MAVAEARLDDQTGGTPAQVGGAGTLREGRDFTSPEELARDRKAARPTRCEAPAGAELVGAALREVQWVLWCGMLPGGVAWDQQPAWRAGLWEAFLSEYERVALLTRGFA